MMQKRYYHPNLREDIDDFSFNVCQRMKRPGPGYGLLPEQDIGMVPWEEFAVDLIGLQTVNIRGTTT